MDKDDKRGEAAVGGRRRSEGRERARQEAAMRAMAKLTVESVGEKERNDEEEEEDS